jgi:hypothetical protein
MWCIGENFNIKKNKLQKISIKTSFTCKSYFCEKKTCDPFSNWVIILVLSYKFWPNMCNEELNDLNLVTHLKGSIST